MRVGAPTFYLAFNLDERCLDMLRYDAAFVREDMFVTPPGDDPARPAGAPIAFADLISPSGRVGGRVTFGRWQSFGCRLVKVADPTGLAALLADFRTCPELWTTRVHPIINGASDYSRLARRTLTDAMNAKSLRELGQPRGSQ